MSRRDKYVKTMRRRLDEWHAEMDTLEAKVEKTHGYLKTQYQEQLSALRARRQEGEEKLEALKSASEDRWEELKVDAEHAWEAFKDSVQQFRSHLKSHFK